MIRVVCDTNIIVSGFFWKGGPRAILDAARAKQFRLVTSEVLITELADVLSRQKFADRLAEIGETAETLLENDYRTLAEVAESAPITSIILDDPDDDHVLACAVGGAADYIVSGDRHLLSLGHHDNIAIITVNDLLSKLQNE